MVPSFPAARLQFALTTSLSDSVTALAPTRFPAAPQPCGPALRFKSSVLGPSSACLARDGSLRRGVLRRASMPVAGSLTGHHMF